jgi:REP element-mobilizing transposase RayT
MGRVPFEFRVWVEADLQGTVNSRSSHGGRRIGAGRKPQRPRTARGFMPHIARPSHDPRNPVHVTLRSGVRPLRSQYVFPTVRGAIADAYRRRHGSFRIVHFSVQVDHLHLIVEADDREALNEGVRGLSISIARRVNRLVNRRGQFWADRWHGRTLETARAVRRAIVYVNGNGHKHGVHSGPAVDPFSSAPYFRGFSDLAGIPPIEHDPLTIPRYLWPPSVAPVAQARSWLLRAGWRNDGSIASYDVPRAARKPDNAEPRVASQ